MQHGSGSSGRWLASASKRWRAWMAIGMLAALAGCASPPTLRTEVARFHAWQATEPLTFAFRPAPAQAGSLEHRSYEQLVRERLLALGFTESPGGRYQVTLDYRATPESRRITEYWSSPTFGPGYAFGPGPWIGRGYAPFWRYDPFWGFPPVPMARDVTVVRHELNLDLYDVRIEPAPGRKVFESRVAAVADVEAMPRLMPGLVSAALAGFPGQSGASGRVEVPLPQPAAR